MRLKSYDDLKAFTHTVRLLMQHSDPKDKRVHAAYRCLNELDRLIARRKARRKAKERHANDDHDDDKNQRKDMDTDQ